MFSLKTSYVDKVLLSVSGLIVLAGVYLLNDEHLLRQMLDLSQSSENEVVGEALYSSNDARRRSESSLTWFPLNSQHRIHNRDSLFVGSQSRLSFKIYPIDTQLELGPGTLVQVIVGKSGPALDFQMGSAELNLGSGRSLSLIHQGREVTLRGTPQSGQTLIQKSPIGNVLIQTLGGSLEVEDEDGKRRSVTEGEKLLLSETTPSQDRSLRKNLKSPKGETWLWPQDPLRFEVNQDIAQGQLHIALDPQFQRRLTSLQFSGRSSEISNWTFEGPVYWQVSPDGQASSDEFQLFTLNLIAPPELEFPINKYSFPDQLLQRGDSVEVEFRFRSRPSVLNHYIEVSRNEEFSPLFARSKITGNRIKLHFDRTGSFYWRVRTDHNHPVDELWSQTRRFWVGDRDSSAMPLAIDPSLVPPATPTAEELPLPEVVDLLAKASSASDEVIDEEEIEEEPTAVPLKIPLLPPTKVQAPSQVDLPPGQAAQVMLSWQAVTGATAYQVQVARDNEFIESREEARTQNTNLRWRSPQPGRVFWRVRSQNESGEWSDYSPTSSLMILAPAPEAPKLVDAKVEVRRAAELLSSPHTVEVALGPVKGASSYALEWSKDPEFTEPQRALASEPNIEIKLEEPGTYFARAVAMTADKEDLSQKTEPIEILYKRTLILEVPRLLQPIDNVQVVSFGGPSDGDDDDESTLFFSWQRVPEALNYRVQFSLTPQFSEVLLEKESDSDSLILDQSLPSGRVFWRVRAEREEFSSSWSRPWSIQGGS